ncbi:MAG: hypothetical protein IPK19_01355 [Chloroflexi bacterium]|nr:hypothetical protein [Chloroflexota bacterium]
MIAGSMTRKYALRRGMVLTLLTLLLAVSLTVQTQVAAAQSIAGQGVGGIVFFLGRSDTDGSGLIDPADNIALYVGGLGRQAQRISAEDANVSQFSVTPDTTFAAYTATVPSGATILEIVAIANGSLRRVELSETTPLSVDAFSDAVWVVALNGSGVPVLRGFEPASGASINSHTFRNPGTPVTIHSNGRFVLAFNEATGGLSVLRLPSLELVQFPLSGFSTTAPSWSPTEPRFVMGVSGTQSLAGTILNDINLNTGAVTQLYTPDFPVTVPILWDWSPAGGFISMVRPQTSGRGLELVNVQTGQASSVLEEGQNHDIVTWSNDDRYVVISRIAADGSAQDATLFVFDTTSGALNPIAGLENYTVAALGWRQDQPLLAIIGQNRSNGVVSLFMIEPLSGANNPIFDGIDATLLRSSPVRWTADGRVVFFASSSNDAVLTSAGTPIALYAADATGSQVIERISPVNVVVDLLKLETR